MISTPAWQMPEPELLTRVMSMAVDRKLLVFHDFHSIYDEPGFPDLVIIGSGILWRELKRERGVLSSVQVKWKYRLIAAGADYAVWQPRDLESGRISRELDSIA